MDLVNSSEGREDPPHVQSEVHMASAPAEYPSIGTLPSEMRAYLQ